MESDTPISESKRTASSEVPDVAPLNRSELIEKHREQSLHKTNPLAANLGLITSDLMVFAKGNAESVLPPSCPESSQRFERQANLHLRIVREINRLVQMDQRFTNRGESEPQNGTEAKN